MRRDLLLLVPLAALAFGPPLVASREEPRLVPAPRPEPDAAPPFHRTAFLPAGAPSVHAATAAPTADGGLLAMWFAGSAEGARDVSILAAELPRGAAEWGEPRVVLDRARLARDLRLPIRRIGNPLLVRDGGVLRLFVAATSLGGWSTSYVVSTESADGGASWARARRLVASPFFNLGTLVRNEPLRYGDGTLGIPVSQELWRPFGELLLVGRKGVRGIARIAAAGEGLQPATVALAPDRAIAFLRRRGDGSPLHRSESADAGRSWTAPEPLDLPNEDSAAAVLALGGDELLLAFSDRRRQRLSLARSLDAGRTWRRVHVVDEGGKGEFSYPFWVVAPDGTFHLLYTWNRTRIAHLAFNRSWLDGRG